MSPHPMRNVNREQFSPFVKQGLTCYRACAFTFFNTVILFVAANLVLWVTFQIHDRSGGGEANTDSGRATNDLEIYHTYGEELVAKAYGDLKKEDRDQLLRETEWATRNLTNEKTLSEAWLSRERPQAGKFVNISENGYRRTTGQGPWPPDADNLNIFLFGGSTAHGTWHGRGRR